MRDSLTRNREKLERMRGALARGLTQVHLDARRPGVLVPQGLRDQAMLVLNFSYRFSPPDLDVNEWGVRQTLTFRGVPFKVGVPWSALYAIVCQPTDELWLYPDDTPDELLAAAAKRSPPPQPAGAEPPARAALREVVSAKDPGDESPPPPPRRHLRLVK